jgi:hypothetical protein
MKRGTGPTSYPGPIDDRSGATEKRYQHSVAIDRPKLLRLALQFSVLEMSELPGMPSADAIYRALASDAAFEREFAKANHVHKQALRAELADLLRRGRTADLSRIFVALCKLRKQTGAIGGESTTAYDFSRLSDEEFSQLDSLLSKASPKSAETADTNERGGNDEHQTTHP